VTPAAAPPVALVVGAGDHIGSAIAKRFAAGGFTLALGRRHPERLAPLAAEIAAAGARAQPYGVDARSEENGQEVFAVIEKELGAPEGVVPNVGANVSCP
jgi:NAD(P)-dependent dehydrogenase (short-subunit alcohol dehydrogenase family)